MINVGAILSTVEGVQCRGGYYEYHEGYLEHRGDTQYCGGISCCTWGDIMMHTKDGIAPCY